MPQRRIVIEGAHVATMDPSSREFPAGAVVVEDHRIAAAGPGPAPGYRDGVPTERIGGSGHLLTPGLVNTHHHFCQWLTKGRAHCVHLDERAIRRLGETGTGVAHCPSSNARLGTGIAPVPELLAAGAPVGLGVDGTASNETGQLGPEVRAALLFARARRGPDALTARQALHAATMGGARCLGRADEIGSIEPGKLADLALWRIDGALHSTIADPVAALALGALPPLTLLLVHGRPCVTGGQLTAADSGTIAREAAAESRRLLTRAGQS